MAHQAGDSAMFSFTSSHFRDVAISALAAVAISAVIVAATVLPAQVATAAVFHL
jgi:hypothetical protein